MTMRVMSWVGVELSALWRREGVGIERDLMNKYFNMELPPE